VFVVPKFVMETTLHRQLKELWRGRNGLLEARVGRFRVDVKRGRRLVEIQHSPLSSIRQKIDCMLGEWQVDIVKPIVTRRRIVMLSRDRREQYARWSPRRQRLLDVFDELVFFGDVFPHPKLRLWIVPVEIVERRYPCKKRRWRGPAWRIDDQSLLQVGPGELVQRAMDLYRLLSPSLPSQFDTRLLADHLNVSRWLAQRIAYVLRRTGAAEAVERRRHGWIYRRGEVGDAPRGQPRKNMS
jgi:hypothetical protein